MKRTVALLLGLALLRAGTALGADAPFACQIPDDLALHDMILPKVREAVATRHDLRILTVGGSSTAGMAGGGAAYTYPTRLADRLRRALPGVTVELTNGGQTESTTRARVDRLQKDLAEMKPDLVIWAPGSSEAGMSQDVDAFVDSLQEGLDKIRAAGADTILIDLQYAPSIARLVDLATYDRAISGIANTDDIPLLRRSELMHRWSDDGTLDLDDAPAANRVGMIRHLFDCIAQGLAEGVASAATAPKEAAP